MDGQLATILDILQLMNSGLSFFVNIACMPICTTLLAIDVTMRLIDRCKNNNRR